MDYGLEALECEEVTTAILNEESYLAKLKERIQPHIKIDEDPTPQHEKKLNAALRKMVKAGKSMPETPKDKQLSLRRDKLAPYITDGAVAPT